MTQRDRGGVTVAAMNPRHLSFSFAASQRAAAAALLLCALPAQETTASTNAYAPAIQLDVLGPAQWRAQFGPTNLGSLLASESAQQIWNGYVGPMQGMVQRMLGMEDRAFAEARARLLDYGGQITIAFDTGGEDEGMRIVLGPDGRTDLPLLLKDLETLASRLSGAEWTAAAEGAAPTLQTSPSSSCSKPTITGDGPSNWTASFAISSDAGLAQAQKDAAALVATLAPQHSSKKAPQPLSFRFDLARMIAAEGTASGDAASMQMFGANALRDLAITIGTAGPNALIESSMSFSGNDRGLFSVIFPDVQGLPSVAALRPDATTLWKTGHCDFAAIDALVRGSNEAAGRTQEELDRDLPPAVFGKDDGVLAHLGNEYALFGTPGSVDEMEEGNFDIGIAMRLRDHAAFAEKWKRARKDLGFTELESETVDGFVVQRLGGLVSVTAAYGPDLLVIGYGKNIREQIDAVLQKAKDGSWTKAEVALPQGLQRNAPNGCNGMAEGRVALIVGQVAALSSIVMGMTGGMDLPFDPEQFDPEAAEALLKQHNLDVARSLTGYRDGKWTMRVFW